MVGEKYTEIMQHRIEWWLCEEDAPDELDESSIEHIEKLIKEGYNQGELCQFGDEDTEYRGWWAIKNICN